MGRAVRQRIVGAGLAVTVIVASALSGLLATWLITVVRNEAVAASHLAELRSDFSRLVAVREQLEAGDELGDVDVDRLIASVGDALTVASSDLHAFDGTMATRLRGSVEEYVTIVTRSIRASDRDVIELTDDRADALVVEVDATMAAGLTELEDRADDAHRWALAGVWCTVVVVVGAALAAFELIGRASRRAQQAESGRRSDNRVRALIEHAPDIVAILSPDGRELVYASPAVTTVLGHASANAADVSLRDLLHPEDTASIRQAFRASLENPDAPVRVVARLRHAAGDWRHVDISLSNRIDDPDIKGVVVNARDISDRIDLERTLSHEARHDPLTGLANRTAFVELVQQELRRTTDADPVSVVFLDLDGFKEINDSLGHGAGDEVLMTVAARLLTLTRQRDHVARLGGDEFALAVTGDDPLALAERLLAVVAEPIGLSSGPVRVGASVGIATSDAETTVDDLLRDADVAMYDAKARGKHRISSFVPEMHHSLTQRLALRDAIDRGLDHEEFRLHFQPLLSLGDGHLVGFEALVRWQRDGTLVPPNDFIPVAEATGQIVALGSWVLRVAVDQLAEWQRDFDEPGLSMAVNVSARQLSDDRFVQHVAEVLHRSGVAPACLTLELTESAVIADLPLAAEVLGELRELGVKIAIDDYGAGHASIGYLREFPIDIVKIDRSFVAALDTSPEHADAYLRSITDLASALGLDTVAEGIEHVGQLERVRSLGCTSGQGFHLARPLDRDATSAYLARRAGAAPAPARRR